MKCKICGNKVEETFLSKPIGTFIKKNGKKFLVCANCQSVHKNLADKLNS